jgi:hypothetical protein
MGGESSAREFIPWPVTNVKDEVLVNAPESLCITIKQKPYKLEIQWLGGVKLK